MINPYFALSGIGMMLAGVLPILWWRYRTLVPWRDFWFGIGVWAVAISLKIGMDVTVTPLFVSWLSGIYTAIGIAIITGAYVGLRTGLFESGLTYVIALKTRLKKMDFQQAVAFGLGFGCAEAFLLGLSSLLNVAVILAYPEILDLMPAIQRAALLTQLSLPTIMALAPIIERVFTILVHVFSAVLVIQAVKSGRVEYFMLSLLYKTGLDGMIPMLTLMFDRTTVSGVYSIEAFIVILGLSGLGGRVWSRGRDGRRHRHKTGKKRGALLVSAAIVMIVALAVITARPNLALPVERRTVNFDDFQGRYDFFLNDRNIGYSEFEFVGGAGEGVYRIKEMTNFSTEEYRMYIEGVLHVTLDARPVFYNMTINKNGNIKNQVFEFGDGGITEKITENNETRTLHININPDSFIIANNMISHWALLFRAVRLEPRNTYIVHIFSPNIEAGFVRSFEVSGVRNVKVDGKNYEAYIFDDGGGNLNYVTPEGGLLKIENSILKIVMSDGNAGEGDALFR